jgi:hypothetical protein
MIGCEAIIKRYFLILISFQAILKNTKLQNTNFSGLFSMMNEEKS